MANVAGPGPTGTKIINQNVFDFVLTHYGNMNFIKQFLDNNELDDILYFGLQDIGTKFNITPQSNRVIKTYNGYQVATGGNPPEGDFNEDYNEDFFIDD